MNPLRLALVLIFLSPVVAFEIRSEIISIDGTVKSIDAKNRTITVETDTKELTLDVGNKAKITSDGEDVKLDSLKVGQKVSASLHDKLDVVVAIDIIGNGIEEVSLFNGADLTGWNQLTHKATKSPEKNTWIVDSDRKVLASIGEDWNELRTDEKFGNFQLSLEWRFTPGRFVSGNGSGIVVRSNGLNTIGFDPRGIEIELRPGKKSPREETGAFTAYSMPITNHSGETLGEVGDGQPSRHLAWLKQAKLKPSNQWNTTEISCEDDRIKVIINDVLVNEGWGVPEEAGHICLRNQNTSIEFRNIKLIKK